MKNKPIYRSCMSTRVNLSKHADVENRSQFITASHTFEMVTQGDLVHIKWPCLKALVPSDFLYHDKFCIIDVSTVCPCRCRCQRPQGSANCLQPVPDPRGGCPCSHSGLLLLCQQRELQKHAGQTHCQLPIPSRGQGVAQEEQGYRGMFLEAVEDEAFPLFLPRLKSFVNLVMIKHNNISKEQVRCKSQWASLRMV